MVMLSDTPLTTEAKELLDRLRPRILTRLEEVKKMPVSVLIWGPGPGSSSPLAECRMRLRTDLRLKGHAAAFSEELCDPTSDCSIRAQQLAQAQEFELIVSIPCTHGAIGEIHDFAIDPRVNAKILVFLNREHFDGYSAQSLEAISTIVSCKIEYYPHERDTAIIESATHEAVQKIREIKYLSAGRL